MPSMYAKYLRERTGDEIVETNKGFATYRFINDGKSCYIIDIYIEPDHRRSLAASALADTVVALAKQRGCVELLGTVVPSTKNSTDSLKVLMGYGMSLQSSTNDLIVFKKAI